MLEEVSSSLAVTAEERLHINVGQLLTFAARRWLTWGRL
jgi:hypothetical protein